MNTEEAFLFSTFREFTKCWRSGTKTRVIMESVNGHAFVNFSAFLGYPDDVHFKFKPRPTQRKPSGVPRKKSARKIKRDNDRAARFQERQREKAASDSLTSKPLDNPEAKATSSPGTESVMTTSGMEFSFASPVPENLRNDSSRHELSVSLIRSDMKVEREKHSGLKWGVRVVPINFGLGWIENGW